MSKRSGPLNYTPVQPTDTDFPLLSELSNKARGYYVTYLDLIKNVRLVWAAYKNFSQAFRACKSLQNSVPRCFVLGVVAGVNSWLAVNPVKMPH